jgi:hypothetical protein
MAESGELPLIAPHSFSLGRSRRNLACLKTYPIECNRSSLRQRWSGHTLPGCSRSFTRGDLP